MAGDLSAPASHYEARGPLIPRGSAPNESWRRTHVASCHLSRLCRWMEGSRAGVGEAPLALGKKPEEIHVLLVDDEKLSRVVVGNLLRKCQYQGVCSACSTESPNLTRYGFQSSVQLAQACIDAVCSPPRSLA